MLKIIEYSNDNEWDSEIRGFVNYDFYYLNNYHKDSKGIPKLIIFNYNIYSIALPIIVRKISGSDYLDVTSVYGYAGPLRSHSKIPLDVINSFQIELIEYFEKSNVVSVFSRLHPLFIQEDLLKGMGDVIKISETVSVDLTIDIAQQRKQYRKGVKSDLSKLKKRGLVIVEDVNHLMIDNFIEIYNENMKRVGADKRYFFPFSYYNNLFMNANTDARLFFVMEGNKAIATSIFIFTKDIIQYHLSGTRNDSLHNSPMRLLIDYIRVFGTKNCYNYLHLGGGVGANDDALLNFKSGFSKVRHDFKLWKFVLNQKIYDALVVDSEINEDDSYFPLYRSKNKLL